MMWGYEGFEFGGGAMGIGMFFFWGLVFATIVVLARGFDETSGETELGRRDREASGTAPADDQRREFLKTAGVEST